MGTFTSQNWVQLNLSVDAAGVVVTPADGDRYALPMEVAMRGCQLASKLLVFQQQFRDLLSELSDWIDERSSAIDKAFVTSKGDGFLFLVIRRDKAFNRSLSEELTDLDTRIAQSETFNLIQLEVLALPHVEDTTIKSFLPPGESLVYDNARSEVAS